jgi:hypothetical protein
MSFYKLIGTFLVLVRSFEIFHDLGIADHSTTIVIQLLEASFSSIGGHCICRGHADSPLVHLLFMHVLELLADSFLFTLPGRFIRALNVLLESLS